ncbi:mercuric reductase [Dictyobacter alpinus]|uniref:Mercuric reductase n=1 Tax=Dictyobacter alpinus TaxID=2014873 RepID=A0A402B0B3_9CHLR|nr:mercuric reductase [Dictyobacter alpinus]GCE24782.1 mercuric reductase [Dictyobacter alpinus]
MPTITEYDVIIIGSGQAGGPLATAFGQDGKKTAIIERAHVGGTCINEGCTPTKTMVASARVAYLARRAADYGVQTAGPIKVDMEVVRKRKRDIVDSFREGSQSRLEKSENVDLLMGEAYFIEPKLIEVRLHSGEVRQLRAKTICLNVGERPSSPTIEGIEHVPFLNSTSIMELDQLPEHLLVLGGGYVGLEFGQMFRRFGSQVTIIQRGKQLLAREDADIADEVIKILREDGVEVLLETSATKVAKAADGQIQLTLHTADGERTISGSHLLAAAGRTPNSDTLNLKVAGIATDKKGYITVNDRLETNVAGIYALGDIKGGPAFTHISYDDFRILRTNLIEHGNASIANRTLVYTVFTDPQLGRVGISETEARQQGRKIKVAKMPMNYVARALEVDEPRGVMKAIVDADTDQILGACILGLEGGEIMSMLEIAMLGKLPYTTLRDGVFAHPTLAESLNNLFGSFES